LPSLIPPPPSSKSSTGTSTIINALSSALKPPIASKQYTFEESLSALVAEAALAVMPPNPKNFNVDNVRVVKIMGGSLAQSRVVRGMVFGREPEGKDGALVSMHRANSVLSKRSSEKSNSC